MAWELCTAVGKGQASTTQGGNRKWAWEDQIREAMGLCAGNAGLSQVQSYRHQREGKVRRHVEGHTPHPPVSVLSRETEAW